MTDLVACLSTGKGTWAEVKKLISNQQWDNIFLISNDFGKEKFTSDKNIKFILVDVNSGIETMKIIIKKELEDKIKTEVAVNFISGSGKEHMALMTALMELGVGLRLVIPTDSEVKEL
jgi:hypothetical protein